MLSKLKYEVIKRESQTNAKITKLINPVLGKEGILTGVFFDARTKEDFKFLIRLFQMKHKLENVKGVQIPFHKLPVFSKKINEVLPKNSFLISDISTEVFFYGNSMKDEKRDFYYTHNMLPKEIKQKMNLVQSRKKFGDKAAEHKQIWREIINDKKLLLQFISNVVSSQMSFNLDMISVPAPLIIDNEHLEFVEECYQNATNLYHGALLDIEQEQGRILALYLNIHKHFLRDATNIRELLITVRRLKPKAIMFKITNLEDIREETNIIDNWKVLIKGLGAMSDEEAFPIIYLSTSAEGMIAQSYGIDCFTQSFYKQDNVEKNIILPSKTMRMLWSQNPKLSSGKISLYDGKDFVSRIDFEKMLKTNKYPPYPMPEVASIDVRSIVSMSPNSFREFAKLILVLQRNFEISEIIEAIKNGDMRILKGKFKKWMKDLELFSL